MEEALELSHEVLQSLKQVYGGVIPWNDYHSPLNHTNHHVPQFVQDAEGGKGRGGEGREGKRRGEGRKEKERRGEGVTIINFAHCVERMSHN